MSVNPDILDKPKTKIFGMSIGTFINLSIISGLTGFLGAFVFQNSYALFGGQC